MVSALTNPSQPAADSTTILAVAAGNSGAMWSVFRGRELDHSHAAPLDSAAAEIARLAREADPEVTVVASSGGAGLETELRAAGLKVRSIGRDLMPPLNHRLRDASTLGVDRALAAYAAWDLTESACVVVDAGTAITVDFVDGEGTFCGGAIGPGLQIMLRSLHEHTASLPDVPFEAPPAADGPFGLETPHAMRLGVLASARGLVRELVERYSESFGAYPRVLATGGDAPVLFETDELVERIIPDLQLIGIQRTVEHAVQADG